MGRMSTPNRAPSQLSIAPEMPRGEVVGRYRTYAEAQKAVDYMSDEHFPVAMVSIIGSDLKSVEQVTGRLSYPRVALQGALNGIFFGAFLGLILTMFGGPEMAASIEQRIRAQAGQVAETMLTAPESEGEEAAAAAE